MKPADEERLTRWIDGEFTDEDVLDLLEAQPALRELKEDALKTGDLLRAEFHPEELLPYADFFNHQVRKRVEDLEEEEAAKPIGWKEEAALFPWFTRMRLLSGVAFVVLLAGFVTWALLQPEAPLTEIVGTYTPEAGVTASSEYSKSARATIIRLNGLEPLPITAQISGYFPKSYEVKDTEVAHMILHSSADGAPILQLSNNLNGLPQIHSLNP